jgi:hypothetical protein
LESFATLEWPGTAALVISAAVLGQAGVDHWNCRLLLIKKFSDRGLAYDEKATAKPSRIWQENDIIEFNAMVRANYTAVSRAALGALSASQGRSAGISINRTANQFL